MSGVVSAVPVPLLTVTAAKVAVFAAVTVRVFTVAMAVISYPIGHLYGQELGRKMRLFSALVFVFPLQLYLQEVLRGTNDITSLAFFNALPQLLYIPAALAINRVTGFSLDSALLLYLLGIADLVGEVLRYAMNAALANDFTEVVRMRTFVKDVYEECSKINLRKPFFHKKLQGFNNCLV